jgi:S-adenosylmethionine hydrolase
VEELGPPVDPEGLVRLDVPELVIADGAIVATLLYVDSFGNIALNLTRDDVERIGVVPGTRVELELSERYYADGRRSPTRRATSSSARQLQNMSLAISAKRFSNAASPGHGSDHARGLSYETGGCRWPRARSF